MIYLDNAATTKPRFEVVEAFTKAAMVYGNPNSQHLLAAEAYEYIELARKQVAKLINAEPEQIIFTSSGSEANNLAIKGFLENNPDAKVVCNSAEHASMIESCLHSRNLKTVNPFLNLTQKDIADADIVSVMHTNNETGRKYDIEKIGKLCHENNTVFVTDAVQALGHCNIDVKKIGCDMMSMSSHKLHGIKGTGALYVKDKALIRPLINGGGTQEYGLRGGTQNVPGIVAFGKACELCNPEESNNYIKRLREEFLRSFSAPDVRILTIGGDPRIIPLTIKDVDAETLVFRLAVKEICVSAGAACKSGSSLPRIALIGQGYTAEEARCTIRISFSEDNLLTEVKKAAREISKTIIELREDRTCLSE